MLPGRILKKDFELIKEELIILNFDLSFKRENQYLECNIGNLLDHCYTLDTSESLEYYCLLDREVVLPGYKLELEVYFDIFCSI
jgi:hypothetical protein